MLQAFIVTLREGVEAALIIGITLAYLAKIERNDLRKSVYAAWIAASVGSIGVAVLLSRPRWNEGVRVGQRAHQSAEIFPSHDHRSALCGGTVNRFRLA